MPPACHFARALVQRLFAACRVSRVTRLGPGVSFSGVSTLYVYMGVVIELKDQLADRSRPRAGSRAAFFFDLACPFSYLVAERVERVLGEVEWIPAPAVGLDGGALWAKWETTRALAERQARAVRLPLVWPDRFPANSRHALRAAAYASENGAGAEFFPGRVPAGLLRRL